jgi:hypothetical protein
MANYDIHTVIALRDNQKLDWADIGDIVGVNQNTLRSAYSRYKSGRKSQQKAEPLYPDYAWPEDVDWRTQLDLAEALLEEVKKFDPYVEYFTIDMSDVKEPIAIAVAADLHLGGGFTDHAAIKETMEYILETPNLYMGLTGDSIEGFIPGNKPAAETVEQMALSTKHQLAAARSLVEEAVMANTLMWMTWGDHDAKWFEQEIGLNSMKQQVHRLVPYFTGAGIIRLLLGSEEYFLLINHAFPGTSIHNPNYPQKKAYDKHFPADVTISAHLHKPAFQMFHHYDALRRVGLNAGGKSWLVQAGTFKTGPDPYTIRTWSRGILGVPTMVIQPNVHDIDVFESPNKAISFMRGLNALNS